MVVVLFIFLIATHVAVSLIILEKPANCSQKGLDCTIQNTCSVSEEDRETPTIQLGREDQRIEWALQMNERGNLVPVLLLHWKAPPDSSILEMKGSEVFVLEKCTNQSICIRYIFHNRLNSPLNSNWNPWSFSSDRVVVDPGCQYSVSFYHLPKPKRSCRTCTTTRNISIPDCKTPQMKECELCVRRGSFWQPNITWSELQSGLNKLVISISFDKWTHSEKYKLGINGTKFFCSKTIEKASQKRLSTNFTLDLLLLTTLNESCHLSIEVIPFSDRCTRDCVDHWGKLHICNYTSLPPRRRLAWIVPGQVLMVLVGVYLAALLHRCFHRGNSTITSISPKTDQLEHIPMKTQRVLILYSLDHALYKEVILKLCAFLRAQCGAEVTLDLLESAWLSTIGKVQWLEMQRERVHSSSDKILILCSRGVAAKWRAMCGGCSVILKEEQDSPTSDMFTPALALIIPDFVRSVSLEKYMVAYFEEVSCAADVPSLFHVTVKYKLMKHFEELLFRILGQEQHEPGRVKRIYGIAEDDYFHCPTGKALRDAIEAFQAYQLGNPDWFNQEIVGYTKEDVGRNCEPLAETLDNHIHDIKDDEGVSVLTNSELNQLKFCASSHTENTYVYPSVNQFALAVSPEITQSQVCLQNNDCSGHGGTLLTGHAFYSKTFKENEEPYWCTGHLKHNPEQGLDVTPLHTSYSYGLEDDCELDEHVARPSATFYDSLWSGANQEYIL